MAEETNETQEVNEEQETQEEQTQQEPEKKYTDEEVNELINKKFAELEDKKEKEIQKEKDKLSEQQKLEKMNDEEKRNHEYKKLEEKLKEYEAKEQHYQLSREASKMLSDADISVGENLLNNLVGEDAETTQKIVNEFTEAFNKAVSADVKEALSGKSPKFNGNTGQSVTKEEFKKMSYPEVLELKNNEPEQYKQLVKGE